MESAHQLFEHELRSTYDATMRLSKGLNEVRKKLGHHQLASEVEDLAKATEEQQRRLEEVFELLGQEPDASESSVIKGFVEEIASLEREKPEREVLDTFVAEAAGDVAGYLMQTFESMLQLAEQAGVTSATPKVSDLLKSSSKEHKRAQKNIQKLTEELVQQLRPA